MKIFVVGYGKMFETVIEGILMTGNEITGVMCFDNVKYNLIQRFFKNAFAPSSDYAFIKKHGLRTINSRGMNRKDFVSFINASGINAVFVCSWGERIRKKTIEGISCPFINVHPSLLPKFRGPNPYIAIILNGERETGVTFHLINENYDEGDIILQTKVEIKENDTGESLKNRCCETAKFEVQNLLNNFDERIKNAVKQDENEATYQKRPDISETVLNFEGETSKQISARIRAFSPWAKCYIPYGNEFFSFEKHEITTETSSAPPGTIVGKTPECFSIVCKDGIIAKFYLPLLLRPFSKYYNAVFIEKFVKKNAKAR